MIARHVEPPTSQTWADEDVIAYPATHGFAVFEIRYPFAMPND